MERRRSAGLTAVWDRGAATVVGSSGQLVWVGERRERR